METSAELIATDEIEELAKRWPADVEEAERILTNEEEAAELVYNFLIPEVNRRFYREELQRQERKYLNAAHRELFDEIESGQLGAQIRDYQELRRDQSVSVNDKEIDNEVIPLNAEEKVKNSSSNEK
ncbi:unnamed protein product [Hymenolepis diminuta]|nr:unnamed protein product [Hymenolepis diminuta]